MVNDSSLGVALAVCVAACMACSSDDGDAPSTVSAPSSAAGGLSFFVVSQTHATGDLGGLAGADAICQSLATAAGASDKTWRAYLSADDDGSGNPVHARDRIGSGPWVNSAGATVAENLESLHTLRGGDSVVLAELMLDEQGQRVNGQWEGSPDPNQHDVLTGSTADGRLMAGMTCDNWGSASSELAAWVGHSDGLGPGMNPEGNFGSWNSSHANESCANTSPRGGAGKFYCFAQ